MDQIQCPSSSQPSSSSAKMPQKHLRDLLGEDQEPFLLNSYIADRRRFLISKNPLVKSQLQSRKQSQASVSSIFSGNLRKASCFSASPDSPEPGRSPIRFNYLRSPKSPNPVFLHVPAKTAALLLEAALRIQRHSAPNKPTTKSSRVLPGFRLFGSLLKRLTHRSETEKARKSREDSVCACSGSNIERCCSTSGFGAESIGDFEQGDDDEKFCESPFRFVLQRSPSSSHCTPQITSPPASSPIRHDLKDKDDDEEEEEEEKEQCSPVCVLDPPFKDDEEEVEDDEAHEHGVGDKDRFDYENSFALVQRAKQQLLRKLFRFEKLAELDPVELEKRLLDQDREDADGPEYAVFSVEEEPVSSSKEEEKVLIKEVDKKSCFEDVTRGVCKRLEMWKDADFKRIDITVDQDLRIDRNGWIERDGEQVGDTAREIEAAIFGLMLEELMEELV